MDLHILNIILQVGQFQDDRQSSRLRTLVAHYTPVQVWILFGSCVLSHASMVKCQTTILINTFDGLIGPSCQHLIIT